MGGFGDLMDVLWDKYGLDIYCFFIGVYFDC